MSLAASLATAEWVQPRYTEVLELIKSRSDGGSDESWGHPVDKIAALWSLCPELTVPEGASGTACDQATCAVVCEAGYIGTGRRRTRCRYTKKKGFFWKRQLGKCETCSQLTTAVGMSQTCEVVNGKTRCTHTCDNPDATLTVGDKTPAKIRVRNRTKK